MRTGPHGGARIGAEITRANKLSAAVLIAGLSVSVVCGWVAAVSAASSFFARHEQKLEVTQQIMRCQPDQTYRPSADNYVGQKWVVPGADS